MIKRYLLMMILLLCLITTACESMNERNEIKRPIELEVEQTSKLENWEIKVTPRLDHNKWVYDTSITFLGDKTLNLTVRTYDNGKIEYEGVNPLIPLETFGNYDYEESVYSKKNSNLSFTLNWNEGDKSYSEVAEFIVKPRK